jgi:NDP-sugar pyrophosphorylase family protein
MTTPLRAGILAAGRGERLRAGSAALKPLVSVGGKTLIEHVLDSLACSGATEVTVIINAESLPVRKQVEAGQWPFDLRWIIETTPSSMHSFLRLLESLAADGMDGPFLISTVDTIAAPHAYAEFLARARNEPAVISLALTSPGDDEKPLLVRLEPGTARVEAFGRGEYATAGVYAVRPVVLREAEEARRDGLDALRKFLRRLLERGYELAGIRISESIDVDDAADVLAAQEFLRHARR